MKKLTLALVVLMLALLAAFAPAQDTSKFPTSFTALYAPKDRHTIAALIVPVGTIRDFKVLKWTFSPEAFVYAGADLQASSAAGGFGLRTSIHPFGPSVPMHVGLAYGTTWDGKPHLSLEIDVSITISK